MFDFQAAAVAGKPEPFVTVLGWVLCIAQVMSSQCFQSESGPSC